MVHGQTNDLRLTRSIWLWVKEELSVNVLSKPDVSMLDQYSKINNSTSRQEFIVRDNQTRQLKFSSSQKIISYDLI